MSSRKPGREDDRHRRAVAASRPPGPARRQPSCRI